MGRAALSLGDRKGAKFYTRQALKLTPDSHAAQLNLALLLGDNLGEVGEACALMREVAAARTAVLGAEHERTRRSARLLADWEAKLKG